MYIIKVIIFTYVNEVIILDDYLIDIYNCIRKSFMCR